MTCSACAIVPSADPWDLQRPAAWRPIHESGLVLGDWITSAGATPEFVFCGQCRMRAWVTYEVRDGGSWNITVFPPEADAVIRADAAPDEVIAAVLAFEQTISLAMNWVSRARYAGAAFVAAIDAALPRAESGTTAFHLLELVRWSISSPVDHQDITAAIAAAPEVLRRLRTLGDRWWERGCIPSVVLDGFARLLDIPALSQALPPLLRIELKGSVSPAARLRATLDRLRGFIQGGIGAEAVRRALCDLDREVLRPLALQVVEVEVLLATLHRLREVEPRVVSPPSWYLKQILTGMLANGRIPVGSRDEVALAIKT